MLNCFSNWFLEVSNKFCAPFFFVFFSFFCTQEGRGNSLVFKVYKVRQLLHLNFCSLMWLQYFILLIEVDFFPFKQHLVVIWGKALWSQQLSKCWMAFSVSHMNSNYSDSLVCFPYTRSFARGFGIAVLLSTGTLLS